MDKKTLVRFDNRDYYWHNKCWITAKNLTISTSLQQKLMEYAIKNGILTEKDFKPVEEQDTKEDVKIMV